MEKLVGMWGVGEDDTKGKHNPYTTASHVAILNRCGHGIHVQNLQGGRSLPRNSPITRTDEHNGPFQCEQCMSNVNRPSQCCQKKSNVNYFACPWCFMCSGGQHSLFGGASEHAPFLSVVILHVNL